MDKLDMKLLSLLEADSRQTNVQLAKKLKVTEGTVRKRIQQLVDKGVIKRFTIEIGAKEGFSAIVMIETNPCLPTLNVVSKLRKLNGVKNIYETTGKWDVAFKVDVDTAEEFNKVIEKIRQTEGVTSSMSLTVLKVS